MTTLWTFKTANFRVECRAHPADDLDLSWDETGEAARRIDSGEYIAFDAEVAVFCRGVKVASEWLGGCIYNSGEEFVTSHRDADPMNRNCSIMRAERGNVAICHYFPAMVAEAIAEARRCLNDAPRLRAA